MQVILQIIQIIFSLVIISMLAGCLYIVVIVVGQSSEGFSVKTFLLNCWFVIKGFINLVLGISAIILLVWACRFIIQSPTINIMVKTDDGSFCLSDSVMVCESTDSTQYYTIKGETNENPGRLQRCLKCNRIYIQHTRWLSPEERRLKENNDNITYWIIQGLATDPI